MQSFPYKGFEITISDNNNDGVYGYTVSKDGEECVFMSETFNSFDEAKKAAKKHVTRGLVFMEGRSAKRARRRHQSRTKVTYWREDLETGGWTASFEDGQSIFEIVLVPEGNRWYWSIYRDGREVQEGDYLDTLNLATILRILENKVKGMSRTYSRRRQSIRGFDNYPEGHGRIKGRDYVIDPVTYDWRFVKYDYSTQDWVTDTSKRTHQGTATSEEDALNQIKNVLGMGGDWYQQMDPSVYSKRALAAMRRRAKTKRARRRRQANYTVRVIWEGELLSQQDFSDENEAYDHFDEMIDVTDRESDPSGTTVQIIRGDNVLGERHFAGHLASRRAHAQWRRHRSLGSDVWDLIVDSGGSSYKKGRVVLLDSGWKAIVMHDNAGGVMATIDGLPSIEKAQEWVSDISGIRVSRTSRRAMRRMALGRRKRSFGNERFRLTNDNGEVIEGSAWELGEMGYWEWAGYDDEGEYGHLWDALNAGDMHWANEISRNLGIRVEEIS